MAIVLYSGEKELTLHAAWIGLRNVVLEEKQVSDFSTCSRFSVLSSSIVCLIMYNCSDLRERNFRNGLEPVWPWFPLSLHTPPPPIPPASASLVCVRNSVQTLISGKGIIRRIPEWSWRQKRAGTSVTLRDPPPPGSCTWFGLRPLGSGRRSLRRRAV